MKVAFRINQGWPYMKILHRKTKRVKRNRYPTLGSEFSNRNKIFDNLWCTMNVFKGERTVWFWQMRIFGILLPLPTIKSHESGRQSQGNQRIFWISKVGSGAGIHIPVIIIVCARLGCRLHHIEFIFSNKSLRVVTMRRPRSRPQNTLR